MNPTTHILYHGSPKLFQVLKPKTHYLANNKPVVFATHLREIALASLQPWNDGVFEQGIVGEDPPYMMGLQPNAFKDVYEGKAGYIYSLNPHTFYHTDRLTRFEQVSEVPPEILRVEFVPDALEALQTSNTQMISFEDSEEFRMNNYRRNPIPQAWGTAPISFTDQDSPNENLDGEDLRDANLKGSDLSGSSFRNADLRGATLFDCDLSHCDFTGANLDGANLVRARADGAIFTDCSMNAALLFDLEELQHVSEFSPTANSQLGGFAIDRARKSATGEALSAGIYRLRESDSPEALNQYVELMLTLTDLYAFFPDTTPQLLSVQGSAERMPLILYASENVNLKYIIASYETLKDADLRGINLRGSELHFIDFTGANLEGADFRDTRLSEVNFIGADLKDANFRGCIADKWTTFVKANLEGADLRDADLSKVRFIGGILDRAKFQGSRLEHHKAFYLTSLDRTEFDMSSDFFTKKFGDLFTGIPKFSK